MSISKVGAFAFYSHPNLERAVVSARVIQEYAFHDCKKIKVVDLTSTSADTINQYAFNACPNLTHLVIRSTTRSVLSAISALDNTKIKLGDGGIYVPADLLDSYKSATNWSTYAKNIYPLGEYPRSNFDSISAAWSTILTNPDYATAYTVKDTKTLELTDGTKIKMDLAAIDTDVKSDNSGTAKMTWICHGVPYNHRMNASATTSGGWVDSEMRSWLISDILSKIPTEIKSHIVSVKKSYRTKVPNNETLISNDKIWLPSFKEVGFTGSTWEESDGIVYSNYFADSASRIKADTNSSPNDWWLRSANNGTNFSVVAYNGGFSNYAASGSYGVVFGFCTD